MLQLSTNYGHYKMEIPQARRLEEIHYTDTLEITDKNLLASHEEQLKEIQTPRLKEEIHVAESSDIGDINLIASHEEQKEELLKVTIDPFIL